MDEADISQARMELEEDLRQKHRTRIKRAFSVDCVECGTDIPEARQAATGGTDLCINCATMLE